MKHPLRCPRTPRGHAKAAKGALQELAHFAIEDGLEDLARLLLDVADFAGNSASWIGAGTMPKTTRGSTLFYARLCEDAGLPVPKRVRSWERDHPELFRELGGVEALPE